MIEGDNKFNYSFSFIAFLCLLLCGYYYFFFFNRAYVELDIEVNRTTLFKLYWASADKGFSEKRRSYVRVHPNKTHYKLYLSDLENISQIRIDTHQYQGEATLLNLSFSQKGYKTIIVDFTTLEPLFDIENYETGFFGLRVNSNGNDPNFVYAVVLETEKINWLAEALYYLIICSVTILLVRIFFPLKYNYTHVPVMLAFAFALVLTMAAVSMRDAHPDEKVHLDATAYYHDNWLPPVIEDSKIEHTYSAYGVSRLNNGEIYYLIAGKVSKFFNNFRINELFSLRIFNVILFGIIILYTMRSIPARAIAVPFLISPQVWYVFSYSCSDSFAMFICFIAGCELIIPNSYLNKLLQRNNKRSLIFPFLFISLMLALLFLLKKNYYPFIAFFYLYILVGIFRSTDREDKILMCKRIVIVSVLGLCFAGIRIGADYYVNGLDKSEKLHAIREKMAQPMFKPSTELNQKHGFLSMKDRGVTLEELIKRDKWFGKNFVTGFGHYGYFTIASPRAYYELVKWAAISLLIYMYIILIAKGCAEQRILGVLTILLSISLIAASLNHSWTKDFQAQGRYLFPILSIFGVLIGRSRKIFETNLFTLGVSQMYLLALYSFIFVALHYIPRS